MAACGRLKVRAFSNNDPNFVAGTQTAPLTPAQVFITAAVAAIGEAANSHVNVGFARTRPTRAL